MKTLRLKTLVCSLSVISGLMLTACNKQTATPETPVAAAPAEVAPVAQASAPASEQAQHLGLYTGTFDPTDEYNKAKADYEKWAEESELGDTLEIKTIPAKYHSMLFRDPLYGYYSFIRPNRLSFVIDEIRADKTFSAHSVAAGNQRPVTGTWEKTEGGLHLVGKEPGDEKNDGSFDIALDEKGIKGTWTPNGENPTPKFFQLVKYDFKFDPMTAQRPDGEENIYFGDSGFEKNPSLVALTSKDVENLTQPQIRMIRNFVFARHGYSFTDRDLRLVFETYGWYVPVTNDVKAELTDMEKKNLELLGKYEKYAANHYDEFGR